MDTTQHRSIKAEKIGVLMGGVSSERDVSLETGASVLDALRRRGWNAIGIDLGKRACQQIVEAELARAFIALHGRYGEDGCVQGLLETLSIPYTGSGVLASAVAMDKVTSKRLFVAAGIPTPSWCHPIEEAAAVELGFPLVVKPRGEGSSVGVAVVHDVDELRRLLDEQLEVPAESSQSLMAERYVPGQELSVAVFGVGAQARALGSVEIRSADGLYDYEAKYRRNDTQYLVPAEVEPPVAAVMLETAVAAHRLLGCSGATRVDLRWPGSAIDPPMVLEINTVPGMTSHSLLPKIAAHIGLSYDELVEMVAVDARLNA